MTQTSNICSAIVFFFWLLPSTFWCLKWTRFAQKLPMPGSFLNAFCLGLKWSSIQCMTDGRALQGWGPTVSRRSLLKTSVPLKHLFLRGFKGRYWKNNYRGREMEDRRELGDCWSQVPGGERHQEKSERVWPWRNRAVKEKKRGGSFISHLEKPDVYKKQWNRIIEGAFYCCEEYLHVSTSLLGRSGVFK